MNTVPNPSTLPPRILMLISYFRQYVSAYVKRSNLVHLLGIVVQAARGLQGGGQDGRRLEMENVQKATLINFQLRKNGRPGKLEAMASFSLQEGKNSYQHCIPTNGKSFRHTPKKGGRYNLKKQTGAKKITTMTPQVAFPHSPVASSYQGRSPAFLRRRRRPSPPSPYMPASAQIGGEGSEAEPSHLISSFS